MQNLQKGKCKMTDTIERNLPETDARPEQASLFSRFAKWLHSDAFKCVLMDIAAYLIILVVFFFVCVPKKYDLTVDSIAPETIKATKDVTDEVTTQSRRDAAASQAKKVFNEISNDELIESLRMAISDLQAVRDYAQSLYITNESETASAEEGDSQASAEENPVSVQNNEEPPAPHEFSQEEIAEAASKLTTLKLTSDEQTAFIQFIMELNPSEFDYMVSEIKGAIESEINSKNFKNESEVEEAILSLLSNEALDPYSIVLQKMIEISIKPTLIYDEEKTEEERQKAMDAVDPVIYLQGRTIIREGEPVYEYQLSMLRSLGLLNDQGVDYSVYGGSAIAVLIAMICLFMSLKLLHADILSDVRKMAVVLIILILSVAVAAVAHLLPSQYVIPAALGAILGTVLIGYRAGICLTFALSLLFASLTSGNASSTFFDVVLIMMMTIAQSIISIWILKGKPQRVRVLLAGLLSSAVSLVMIIGTKWLTSSESLDVLSFGAWAFAGGILSGALAVAFQPLLEQLFRLATPSRLLELTNPNQPLMKRLMIEAPGTYHHSIIVANLAEAAADKIKANPYLARAGAYYHDIGKLKRPGYFKENQNNDNPHERTDPYVSAAILISHTMDGVLLAQKEHMPREVQDIILQHHGVTPVMFFYHKALQMSDGSHVDIDEFRYSGPKPKTKEAAIVMLADTIEAAVRSMKDPTPKGIDQFIERLVRGKLEDGQLSDSPLSLSDIDQICEAFSGILKGVYHERIEYPNVPHYAGKAVPVPEPEENKSGSAQANERHSATPESSQKQSADSQDKPAPEQTTEKGKDETSNEA